ncbi:hypothetical protein GCM10027414_30260 [Humibacter ginsengiterrae]
MARIPGGPDEPDDNDDDLSSLFGVGDGSEGEATGNDSVYDTEVDDDDPDAYEPAFPPVPSATPRPAPELPDPRAAPPTYDIPELSMPIPPRPESTHRTPTNSLSGEGESTFFWGLTPNDEPDPLVHGSGAKEEDDASADAHDSRGEDEELQHHRGLVPPTVPLAPYVPPEFERPAAEVEPATPQPAEPWASEPAEPTVPEFAEPPVPEPAEPVTPAAAEPPAPSQQPGPFAIPPTGPTVPPMLPAVPPNVEVVPGTVPPPTIAVPAWTPPDPTPAAPAQPAASESTGSPTAATEEPGATADASPAEPEPPSAPGTVTLPWLRRSRRRAEQETAADAPHAPSAPGAVPVFGAPRAELAAKPPAEPPAEPAPPTKPVASTSWSLFGDLVDGQPETSGIETSGIETPAAPDDSDATESSQATENANEAAAFGTLRDDNEALTWPWGASAVATPQTADAAADATDETATRSIAAAAEGASATGAGAGAAGAGASATGADAATAATAASSGTGAPEHRSRRSRRSASGGPEDSGTTGGSARAHWGSGGGSGHPDDDTSGPSPRAQCIMLIVACAMLLVLLLIALFIVGRTAMQPIAAVTPRPTPTKTATPTPTPTATPVATGPQAPGKHPWNTLRGGECLQPFTTAWANTFTVVDCAAPHAGQMVYTGVFSTDPKAAFPGADQLASQINVLCSRPGVLNLDAAGQYDDAQVQGSYPVTAKQWQDGQRSYYCFVSRSSGQPITGSLAGPGPQ